MPTCGVGDRSFHKFISASQVCNRKFVMCEEESLMFLGFRVQGLHCPFKLRDMDVQGYLAPAAAEMTLSELIMLC
jgi:hypothetical protein